MNVLNRNVLVLNYSYEPLNITNVKRAVCLILLDKAQRVENMNGKVLRYINGEFKVPSVIRIMRYINPFKRKVKFSRANIIKRDGGRCQFCGKKSKNLTIDHVIPLSMGGKHSWENCVACCPECNIKKGDRTPEMANMELLSKPKEPNIYTFLGDGEFARRQEWRKYLFLSQQ
ncbi:MAG: HNH endonuclease [Candidatus Coatesbacteria bacterium]|nr:MAG: HNH endonuclease [Candidatus Coatesbacteria bacterium]